MNLLVNFCDEPQVCLDGENWFTAAEVAREFQKIYNERDEYRQALVERGCHFIFCAEAETNCRECAVTKRINQRLQEGSR